MIQLVWGAGTDTGHRRQRNEDAYLGSPRICAVADGMGGHARGDLAARLAVERLEQLTYSADETRAGGPPLILSRAAVLDAVRDADRRITADATGDPDRPMGTTLCGLARLDHVAQPLLVFNVGDSRVYRLRADVLDQVSHDHSVVQELIDTGELDPHQAELHPDRNVITRSLGSGEPLDVDWWSLEAQDGDRYLLCSDGLVKELATEQISAILGSGEPPQSVADALVRAALDAGGRDNVTVVVVDVVVLDGPGKTDQPDLDADTNPRQTADGPTQPRGELSGSTLRIDHTHPLPGAKPPATAGARPTVIAGEPSDLGRAHRHVPEPSNHGGDHA